MKTLADIQFFIAATSAAVFFLPSIMFILTPAVFVLALVWWAGIHFMNGYVRISEGTISNERAHNIWLGSFFFNLPGFIFYVVFLATMLINKFDLETVSIISLAALPAVAGTVVSFIGSATAKKLVDAGLEQQRVP